MSVLLEARGLTVRYGRHVALEDVAFEVPAGEVVAVVGPNGAGKTTLFKAALGALAPTVGAIRGSAPAYVPQGEDEQLHYPLTALDVALMGGYRRRAWWQPLGRALRREAHAQLERVGLGARAQAQFGELSGGQRQRVLLARALLSRRDLLLLDEPLNGVDATTQEVVVGLLEELRREGRSVLVSTHDLTLARRISTRMLFLNRRVVAYGPTAEAFTAEVLRQTYAGSLLVVEPQHGDLLELIDVGAHGCDQDHHG